MAKKNGKKITLGSVVGILIVIAIFIAKQQGWLPATGDEAANENTRTAQNDRSANDDDATTGSRNNTGETRDTPRTPQTQTPDPQRDRVDNTPRDVPHNTGRTGTAAIPGGDGGIGEHFRNERRDVIVTASGMVKRVLPDDNEGSRHQKLIVTLSTGATVLIAHNIDLAPRVPCDEGDLIKFRGEYEYNERGGVVHWTHHDPAGRHQPGWIEFEGVRYE